MPASSSAEAIPRSGATPWRVWLSGASSGLGEALARELVSRGSRVALFARREENLKRIREQLLRSFPGSEVLVQAGDVRDRARVREAVAEARSKFGGIDVLLLNAGIGDSLFPDKFDAELVERIMAVNYLGAVYGIEAALPDMLARKSGTIVGVSSVGAVRGFPTAGPYCASKAALTSFLESLRLDLWGRGVKVITVSPGFIKTPLTDRNRFPMPFIQPADRAARRIVDGIAKGKREIHFPRRLTIPLKLLRCLPGGLYDRIFSRMISGKGYRKERETSENG
jgi:NAD(P)-dependent dehydrogenase (short-subunit alcohol dehydrogenase family)